MTTEVWPSALWPTVAIDADQLNKEMSCQEQLRGNSRSSPAQRVDRASAEARYIASMTLPVDTAQVIK